MDWIRKNWGIISGVTVALCFIVGSLINHYTLETEMKFEMESAKDQRKRLTNTDEELKDRVSVNEKSLRQQSETLVRIETQQTAIQSSTRRTSKKIDKMDDKLDRILLKR